ncbi:MAG: phospholipid carrier-dependent glycosyltransferase [Pirellulaceae bacterium]|nr:phospholipid carrier-dependent glycosyltransferase [Pirellulaceae bacterium]
MRYLQKSIGLNMRTAAEFLLFVAATAGLRSAAIATRADALERDPDAYRLIAENLVARGTYSRSGPDVPPVPTAFRPPLYPLLLAATACHGTVSPHQVAVIHVLLGTLTAVLTWWLARSWGLGRASWCAGMLVAVDPILLHQSAEVMTETLATLFAVVGLVSLTWWSRRATSATAALAGGVLGLSILCRPTFLVWAALCGMFVLLRLQNRRGLQQLAVFLLALGSILMPWGWRNLRATSHFTVTTTHGGFTLLLANNPYFYEHLRVSRWGSVWDGQELLPMLRGDRHPAAAPASSQENEYDADRRYYALARQTIRQQPGMFAWSSLARVGYLWSPLPRQIDPQESWRGRLVRWLTAVWYTGVLAMAALGAWRLGRRWSYAPWVWAGLFLLALTAVHAVYWTNMRMRAPAMPIVYLAAVTACCHPRSSNGNPETVVE